MKKKVTKKSRSFTEKFNETGRKTSTNLSFNISPVATVTKKPIHYTEFSNQRSPMLEFLHNELKQADVCFMKLLAEDCKKKF